MERVAVCSITVRHIGSDDDGGAVIGWHITEEQEAQVHALLGPPMIQKIITPETAGILRMAGAAMDNMPTLIARDEV